MQLATLMICAMSDLAISGWCYYLATPTKTVVSRPDIILKNGAGGRIIIISHY